MKRVTGKNSLLFRVAEASLSQPEGVVKEVVYPVVGEETLRDLVAEWQATASSKSRADHHLQLVPLLLPPYAAQAS